MPDMPADPPDRSSLSGNPAGIERQPTDPSTPANPQITNQGQMGNVNIGGQQTNIEQINSAGGAVVVSGSVYDYRGATVYQSAPMLRANHVYTGPILSPQEQQNRARMLTRVRAIWITGVLKHSLAAAVPVTPALYTVPSLVANPWQPVLDTPVPPPVPLPPGVSLTTVFDESSGSLLILGAPGSGKTTLLLALAQDLLDRAAGDIIQPIPVVFHLATWTETRAPLVEWLVAELRDKYQVPAAVGQAWLDHDQILLLLDGLDEVAAPHQAACVAAIHTYRQAHLVGLVVCCRLAEYATLETPLSLAQAVVVQPLTAAQIAAALASGSPVVTRLTSALLSDPGLRDLLDTPLMLTVLAHAYADMPAETPLALTRQQLFAAYIDRVLTRQPGTPPSTPDQTVRWLAWLARQLMAHNQPVFYLEHLQPAWLPPGPRRTYAVLLAAGFALTWGLVFALAWGAAFGLIGGLIWGVVSGRGAIRPAEAVGRSIRSLGRGFPTTWLPHLGVGLVFGLFIGFVGGLGVGLLSGILVGLIGGLFSGLSLDTLPDQQRLRPNHGIRQSARTGLLLAPVVALVCGLGFAAVFSWGSGLGDELTTWLGYGLFGVLAGGLFGGLTSGWEACVQHLVLRLMLWRSGAIPLNYVRFLDYATDRILLRRAGGGYQFIHRLLLEYFAGLDLDSPPASTAKPGK